MFEGSYLVRNKSLWSNSQSRYTYSYKLRVYIGDYTSLVVPFTILLTEPCKNTVVNSQPLGPVYYVILGGANLIIDYDDFTDTVS